MTDIEKFYIVVMVVAEVVLIVFCIYQEIVIEELKKRISNLDMVNQGFINEKTLMYIRIDALEDDYGKLEKAIKRVRKKQNRGRKQSRNLDKAERDVSSSD
nr:MAG TPA: hypothetical protein [Caudoviricetes sp.]